MMKKSLILTRIWGVVSLVGVFLMVGCATTPPPEEVRSPVFYPPLPNPPHIQYLTTFSAAKDIKEARSAFVTFILGKDPGDEMTVNKPYGVAFSHGKLFVVDTRGPGYVIFDLEQKQFKFVPGSGNGKMQKPINITVDEDGTRYITDVGKNQVLAFDREDRFLRAYGVIDQFRPGDVVIVGDRLYVSDLKHQNIQVLDKQSGDLLFRFGERSKGNELMWPTNMTVGDGHLYVTDTGNFRIQEYTLDGTFVRNYGTIGTSLGQFARPKGIALDREGRMYVVDAAFENVQIFDPEGRVLLFFGGPGSRPENINLPTAVVIDYENASLFQKYADPKFTLEYVIAVASQFGRSKVNVFGFGEMEGMDYPISEQAETKEP